MEPTAVVLLPLSALDAWVVFASIVCATGLTVFRTIKKKKGDSSTFMSDALDGGMLAIGIIFVISVLIPTPLDLLYRSRGMFIPLAGVYLVLNAVRSLIVSGRGRGR